MKVYTCLQSYDYKSQQIENKETCRNIMGEHLTVVKIRVNVNMSLKQSVSDMVIIIIILYLLYNYYFTVVNIYQCRTEL